MYLRLVYSSTQYLTHRLCYSIIQLHCSLKSKWGVGRKDEGRLSGDIGRKIEVGKVLQKKSAGQNSLLSWVVRKPKNLKERNRLEEMEVST